MFDVNIYLNVAELVGPPFTWSKLQAFAATLAGDPVPHEDPRCDSLRAIAACSTGRFAGKHPLHVWTGSHIDALVRFKAQQPNDPALYPEDRGLGWSADDAQTLVDELVWGIVHRSTGGSVGDIFPDGNPPLSHEDGVVYGTAKQSADGDVVCERYCVTHDRDFLQADLPSYPRRLTPATFVALTRTARATIATQAYRPNGRAPE